MLYPTNSADRRQQPCTTTIRSRRAHPRHVLDTAALNAYVPNNVGSKSHNELTWNHVVSVFTFFGLLMTALVSLCCWSHFQFIVERRRLVVTLMSHTSNLTVSNAGKEVTYKKTSTEVPKWFKTNPLMNKSEHMKEITNKWKETPGQEQQIHIFGGSNEFSNKDTWAAHAGKEWYISTDGKESVIFFDKVQEKWHMGGKEGLMYRSPGKSNEVPMVKGERKKEIVGWFSKAGRAVAKDGKKAKPHFAIGDDLSNKTFFLK